jgi:iron uptake system component EfeO
MVRVFYFLVSDYSRIFYFLFVRISRAKSSRHKTAYEADKIACLLWLDISGCAASGAIITLRRALFLALVALGVARTAVATTLDTGAENYRPYIIEGIGQALSGARDLRERIAAGDLAGAKKAWISARAGWERSEVFTAGFVPELDSEIDAWPNADSGFHAIEARLFGAGRTDVDHDTDALVENLDSLHGKLRDMALTPQGLLDGIVRLAYEVGESKADGGESRISGTSLDDMRNNVAGIEFAYRTIFSTALKTADAKLADGVEARIEQLKTIVVARDLPSVDVTALRRASEELVILLQNASAKLGLQRATLEAKSQ